MKCRLTMAALVLLIFAPASGVFGQDAEEADAPVDPAVAYQAAADSVDTDLAATNVFMSIDAATQRFLAVIQMQRGDRVFGQ